MPCGRRQHDQAVRVAASPCFRFAFAVGANALSQAHVSIQSPKLKSFVGCHISESIRLRHSVMSTWTGNLLRHTFAGLYERHIHNLTSQSVRTMLPRQMHLW